MTENNRFRRFYNYLIENETNKKYDIQDCCNLLNNLSNENEQLRKDATTLIYANQDYRHENEKLKQILNELSDMLQFDVENGIRSYPVKLSEYLSNALKELQRND